MSLENFLILNNNQIKYCDLGLSKIFQNNNFKLNGFAGKRQYQSPEK